MDRLTDRKVAADLKRNCEGLQAAGIEPNMSDLRYIKLAEYEDAEEIREIEKNMEFCGTMSWKSAIIRRFDERR